jgi:hypothetical protein
VALAAMLFCGPSAVLADDYRVEAASGPAPAADLSADVAAQLSPAGFKVIQGPKKVVCEIWPAKQWMTKADAKLAEGVIYPLEIGQLIGVLRFPRKGADFRGQEIPAGVYTLRYGNQPVDGNHVGTFETRDFLLLLPARTDQSPQPIAEADLFKTSAQSAESSHPAIMPLVKAEEGDAPAIHQLDGHEWWAVRFVGNSKAGKLPLELIVAGKAD